MKSFITHSLIGVSLSAVLWSGTFSARAASFAVVLDAPAHGKLTLAPPLPADGKYEAGTVVTVTTQPEAGYVGGTGHAFFDWKPDAQTKATFAEYGVYYAAEMKAFFASVLR